MSGTDTSRWTSQFVIRIAIIAAVVGCVGPLAFALVRSSSGGPTKAKKVATVGQVALNSSPAASESRTPAARSSEAASSVPTTVAGTPMTVTTTPTVTVVSTTSTTITTASTAPQV